MKSRSTELKTILNDFAKEYTARSEASYNNYIKTLAPGSTLPPKGGFFGKADKMAFSVEAENLKLKAYGIIDDEIAELKAKQTATPTDDDVRTLSLLNMRTTIGREELNNYADRFAGSEICYRTLQDIARKNDYFLPDNLIETKIANLNDLKSSIGRSLTPDKAINENTASDGFGAFMGMYVDDYFSES